MGMVDKTKIKSTQALNDWLVSGNLTDKDYNIKVINRLQQLNEPDDYANPCFNCGSNHTIYDSLRVTERDVRNLDMLINEYHGSLILKNISVSNDTDYHDKRNFYNLVYYGLAIRTDEMQDDGNFKQTYAVTELGKQFAAGLVPIPAYYAQRDNEIIDRSNNYLIYRDEVFENKFCMQNVLDCNRIIVSNYKKTNTRDIIYGLLSDGVYLGYIEDTNTFWLLKEIVIHKDRTYDFIETGENIIKEMRRLNIKKKSFKLISIEPKTKSIYKYKKIYNEKLFTLFNAK